MQLCCTMIVNVVSVVRKGARAAVGGDSGASRTRHHRPFQPQQQIQHRILIVVVVYDLHIHNIRRIYLIVCLHVVVCRIVFASIV